MLVKKQLRHGCYYRGDCRNAEVARWHAPQEIFYYRRHKFGDSFIETIRHPDDDRIYDVFMPQAECPATVPPIEFPE